MTMAGIGLANAVTRSAGGPFLSMASRQSAVICSMRSVSSRMRRTVNLPTSGWDVHHPFGGFADSGSAFKEQGREALTFYSRVKTVAVHSSFSALG